MTSKDTHDPGWNDPPTFTYDKAAAIQAAASNRKGIYLNKRIAFPMSGNLNNPQGTQPNQSISLVMGKPPPMMSQPPPGIPVSKSEVQTTLEPQSQVKVTGKDGLTKVLQNIQIDMLEDEIAKRIRIMEKMWNEGKLDENVQLRILELSEALAAGNAEAADHIQKGLMVDYISQCSSWMGGIRHLINKKRNEES